MYDAPNKNTVAVAVVIGFEPLKLSKQRDTFDAEAAIVKLAERIKRIRRKAKKNDSQSRQ